MSRRWNSQHRDREPFRGAQTRAASSTSHRTAAPIRAHRRAGRSRAADRAHLDASIAQRPPSAASTGPRSRPRERELQLDPAPAVGAASHRDGTSGRDAAGGSRSSRLPIARPSQHEHASSSVRPAASAARISSRRARQHSATARDEEEAVAQPLDQVELVGREQHRRTLRRAARA